MSLRINTTLLFIAASSCHGAASPVSGASSPVATDLLANFQQISKSPAWSPAVTSAEKTSWQGALDAPGDYRIGGYTIKQFGTALKLSEADGRTMSTEFGTLAQYWSKLGFDAKNAAVSRVDIEEATAKLTSSVSEQIASRAPDFTTQDRLLLAKLSLVDIADKIHSASPQTTALGLVNAPNLVAQPFLVQYPPVGNCRKDEWSYRCIMTDDGPCEKLKNDAELAYTKYHDCKDKEQPGTASCQADSTSMLAAEDAYKTRCDTESTLFNKREGKEFDTKTY